MKMLGMRHMRPLFWILIEVHDGVPDMVVAALREPAEGGGEGRRKFKFFINALKNDTLGKVVSSRPDASVDTPIALNYRLPTSTNHRYQCGSLFALRFT